MGIHITIFKSGVLWVDGWCGLSFVLCRYAYKGHASQGLKWREQHTLSWCVMSEQWQYICSGSEDSPQSWLEARDLFSVNMRAGDVQREPRSESYQHVSRGPRGVIQCHKYPSVMKGQVLPSQAGSSVIQFDSSKEILYFSTWENYTFGGNYSCFILFSGHFFFNKQEIFLFKFLINSILSSQRSYFKLVDITYWSGFLKNMAGWWGSYQMSI